MKKIVQFFILIFLFSHLFVSAQSMAPHRGMFVSVIQNEPTLQSTEAIKELIRFSKKAGIQTLFIQIYRANKAWFPSEVGDSVPYEEALENVGQDPFGLLIKEAHAAGIEVHAWLNLMSLGDNPNAKILKKYGPEILTRNTADKKNLEDYKIDNQYWLEPGDLRVRQELQTLVEEIVSRYSDLDGIQFDYIRYPDTQPAYGQTKENLERFFKETGLKNPGEKDESWRRWKRNQITETVKALSLRAKSIHPQIHVSTTGCMSYFRAREEAFQDWPLWLNEGVVEFVTMMSYPPDVETFQSYLKEAKSKVNEFSKLNVAIGAYKLTQKPEIFEKQWQICEKAGGRSCVVFHYGDLLEVPALAKPLLPKEVST